MVDLSALDLLHNRFMFCFPFDGRYAAAGNARFGDLPAAWFRASMSPGHFAIEIADRRMGPKQLRANRILAFRPIDSAGPCFYNPHAQLGTGSDPRGDHMQLGTGFRYRRVPDF